MPVYNPIKPSLPKEEFHSNNKRKIFFISISVILIVISIILLYFAFRPVKTTTQSTEKAANVQDQSKSNQESESSTAENNQQTSANKTYKVESGDTLFTIGQKFDIDWHKIATANDLKEPYDLKVGQELVIPEK
jgi:LysM repeat protein